MPYVFLLFITLPIIEIAVMLKVGAILGWLPTLGIVILTAIIGTAMLRQQGLATINKARRRMDAGEMPAQQLLDAMFLLLGGVFLLTPGFVTDAFGFACLIPATRRWLAARVAARSVVSVGGAFGGATPAGQHEARGPGMGGSVKGATVGSGSTEGARSRSEQAETPMAGGRPQPADFSQHRDSASGKVIDAEFKRLDD